MVIVFLAVWLIPALELLHLHRLMKTDAFSSGKLAANSLSMIVDANLKRFDEVLLDLRPHAGEPYEKFNARVKARVSNISDLVFHVSMADGDGKQSFSTIKRNFGNISLKDRSYFTRFANQPNLDVLNISEPVIGRVSGQWSVQFTRPIYLNGQFKGIINASVRPSFLTQSIPEKVGMPQVAIEVCKQDGSQGLVFIAGIRDKDVLSEFWPVVQRVVPITALLSLFCLFGVYIYFSRRNAQAAYVGRLKLNRKISGSSQKVARLGDYLWDEQTQKFRSSKALNAILGLGEATILSLKDFLELVHTEDRALLFQAIAECDGDGNPVDLVFRWLPSLFSPIFSQP